MNRHPSLVQLIINGTPAGEWIAMERLKLSLVTSDNVRQMSTEQFAAEMQAAFDVGLADGAVKEVDTMVKHPELDDDIVRSYLRGWAIGAGQLLPEEYKL